MTTSPTPWHANNGTIRDFNGRVIAVFNDWRDAEVICGEMTDRMAELEEEVKNSDHEWELADAECDDLIKKFFDMEKLLDSDEDLATKLEKIRETIKKVTEDETDREYIPIDRREP